MTEMSQQNKTALAYQEQKTVLDPASYTTVCHNISVYCYGKF